MTDEPKAALAAAISRPGPVAPLEALGHAARWAALTLQAQVAEDDVAAFECVIALDDALSRLAGLLNCLPDLLRVASPGRTVSERLASAEAEVSRQRSQLATERARLEQARDVELRAAELVAERGRLRLRIAELERSSLIERELPALRTLLAGLEATISPATVNEGEEASRRLATASGRLLELTEEQQALIQQQNVPLVPALATATEAVAREKARHDDLTAQLAAMERDAEQLAAERERTLPGLRARQEADRDLLAGLDAGGLPVGDSAAVRVRSELAGLQRRIADAEGLLRPLLLRHAQAYEDARKMRGWSG